MAVSTASVQSIVEDLAAQQGGHPFGASYVAQRAGIDVPGAYEQLEALAQRGDLERHFELISPTTGRSLQEFHIGDELPMGETYESELDEEEPFVVGPEDILISFSPTERLRARAANMQKKKLASRPVESSPELQRMRAQLQATLAALQRAMREIAGKIRSEARRRSTTSTTTGR